VSLPNAAAADIYLAPPPPVKTGRGTATDLSEPAQISVPLDPLIRMVSAARPEAWMRA